MAERTSHNFIRNDDAFGQQIQFVVVLSELLDTLPEQLLVQYLLLCGVCPFQQKGLANKHCKLIYGRLHNVLGANELCIQCQNFG